MKSPQSIYFVYIRVHISNIKKVFFFFFSAAELKIPLLHFYGASFKKKFLLPGRAGGQAEGGGGGFLQTSKSIMKTFCSRPKCGEVYCNE